jgi:hypothetical protein
VAAELAGQPASFVDCFAYALALAVARGATLLDRAFGQMLPTEVTDLLGAQEDEYGQIPAADPNVPSTTRGSRQRRASPEPGVAPEDVRALGVRLPGVHALSERPMAAYTSCSTSASICRC